MTNYDPTVCTLKRGGGGESGDTENIWLKPDHLYTLLNFGKTLTWGDNAFLDSFSYFYFGLELKAIKNAHIDSKIELIVKAREIDKCFR